MATFSTSPIGSSRWSNPSPCPTNPSQSSSVPTFHPLLSEERIRLSRIPPLTLQHHCKRSTWQAEYHFRRSWLPQESLVEEDILNTRSTSQKSCTKEAPKRRETPSLLLLLINRRLTLPLLLPLPLLLLLLSPATTSDFCYYYLCSCYFH